MLLSSTSAMLCQQVPVYQPQLGAAAVSHALASGELHELFHTPFSKPLQLVEAPSGGPMVMCIGALDEVPVDTQSVSERLNVIVNMVPLLPHWLRIFVTSRDNHQVRRTLEQFEPLVPPLEGPLHRADMRAYPRLVVRRYVHCDCNAPALKRLVEDEFPELSGMMEGQLRGLERASAAEFKRTQSAVPLYWPSSAHSLPLRQRKSRSTAATAPLPTSRHSGRPPASQGPH